MLVYPDPYRGLNILKWEAVLPIMLCHSRLEVFCVNRSQLDEVLLALNTGEFHL
jgi:hypothetical protein